MEFSQAQFLWLSWNRATLHMPSPPQASGRFVKTANAELCASWEDTIGKDLIWTESFICVLTLSLKVNCLAFTLQGSEIRAPWSLGGAGERQGSGVGTWNAMVHPSILRFIIRGQKVLRTSWARIPSLSVWSAFFSGHFFFFWLLQMSGFGEREIAVKTGRKRKVVLLVKVCFWWEWDFL